jgi:hypothetical protein
MDRRSAALLNGGVKATEVTLKPSDPKAAKTGHVRFPPNSDLQ